jgi:hypothetical protein
MLVMDCESFLESSKEQRNRRGSGVHNEKLPAPEFEAKFALPESGLVSVTDQKWMMIKMYKMCLRFAPAQVLLHGSQFFLRSQYSIHVKRIVTTIVIGFYVHNFNKETVRVRCIDMIRNTVVCSTRGHIHFFQNCLEPRNRARRLSHNYIIYWLG